MTAIVLGAAVFLGGVIAGAAWWVLWMWDYEKRPQPPPGDEQ
jgi:hypothetical protein